VRAEPMHTYSGLANDLDRRSTQPRDTNTDASGGVLLQNFYFRYRRA
jgi:hypothetical protein